MHYKCTGKSNNHTTCLLPYNHCNAMYNNDVSSFNPTISRHLEAKSVCIKSGLQVLNYTLAPCTVQLIWTGTHVTPSSFLAVHFICLHIFHITCQHNHIGTPAHGQRHAHSHTLDTRLTSSLWPPATVASRPLGGPADAVVGLPLLPAAYPGLLEAWSGAVVIATEPPRLGLPAV